MGEHRSGLASVMISRLVVERRYEVRTRPFCCLAVVVVVSLDSRRVELMSDRGCSKGAVATSRSYIVMS